MKIIPAIDLKDGRCVRLLKGDFNEVTDYSGDPASVARAFASMSFEYLHIVDLDGAREGSQRNQSFITEIMAASDMSVQVGGGIRNLQAVDRWLAAGAVRCVVGSPAVTDPDLISSMLTTYGGDRIVLALDVRVGTDEVPRLAIHGWTETSHLSLWECVDTFLADGLQHVLCTDVGRDGALSGPNINLYREFVRRYPQLHLQASGGVRDIGDLEAARSCGAWGAITGRALLDRRIRAEEIAAFRQNA